MRTANERSTPLGTNYTDLAIMTRSIDPNVGLSELSKFDQLEPLRDGLCLCRNLLGEDVFDAKGLLPAT